jgi:hypothetical protein
VGWGSRKAQRHARMHAGGRGLYSTSVRVVGDEVGHCSGRQRRLARCAWACSSGRASPCNPREIAAEMAEHHTITLSQPCCMQAACLPGSGHAHKACTIARTNGSSLRATLLLRVQQGLQPHCAEPRAEPPPGCPPDQRWHNAASLLVGAVQGVRQQRPATGHPGHQAPLVCQPPCTAGQPGPRHAMAGAWRSCCFCCRSRCSCCSRCCCCLLLRESITAGSRSCSGPWLHCTPAAALQPGPAAGCWHWPAAAAAALRPACT